MLPIGDICNLKSLICSFLNFLRDMVKFQLLHIVENNFKSLQLLTFRLLARVNPKLPQMVPKLQILLDKGKVTFNDNNKRKDFGF